MREIWLSNIAGKVPTVNQLELASSNLGYNRVDAIFYGLKIVGGVKSVVPLGENLETSTHDRQHDMLSLADHAASSAENRGKLLGFNAETGAPEAVDKNSLAGEVPEIIASDYSDITKGVSQTYTLVLKAKYSFRIDSLCMEVDNGTLTGIAIKINGVSVGGLSSVTADTSVDETAATGSNIVNEGDRVTLVTSAGYTGTPTMLRQQLNITRI